MERIALGLAVIAASLVPTTLAAQASLSLGVLIVPEPGIGDAQVGPAITAAYAASVLRLPLFLEVGVARTDFTSLGQDYHDNHYLFAVGSEWFATQGTTRLGFRLALGAYLESQIVETNPASRGGDNWVEALAPGLIVEHELKSGRRLFVELTDFMLGPFYAVFDSSEYDLEHRVRIAIGVRTKR